MQTPPKCKSQLAEKERGRDTETETALFCKGVFFAFIQRLGADYPPRHSGIARRSLQQASLQKRLRAMKKEFPSAALRVKGATLIFRKCSRRLAYFAVAENDCVKRIRHRCLQVSLFCKKQKQKRRHQCTLPHNLCWLLGVVFLSGNGSALSQRGRRFFLGFSLLVD